MVILNHIQGQAVHSGLDSTILLSLGKAPTNFSFKASSMENKIGIFLR